jgi:two-component system cell cycle sensor histidine kinase/response regulator CckA
MPGRVTAKPMLPPVLAAAAAAPAGGLSVSLPGAANILVVEDDGPLRELLRLTLESGDYHVAVAADGAEALRLVERQSLPIALLVSDVVMPGMAGPELARRLAASRAGLKVLLLSGYPRDRALLDPQVAFLQKPFHPRSLLATVRELLGTDGGRNA